VTDSPRDVAALRQRVDAGWRPGFVFFLAPEASTAPAPGSGCLSQWYAAPMTSDGERFHTAEHYMMWRKAMLFGDHGTARMILADADPAVAKRLGREVRNYDDTAWVRHRAEVVLDGSLLKFRQHPRLAQYLAATGDAILAETSPVDLIWGIGFGEEDERARDPQVWPGMNLLGFVLMEARRRMQA